MGDTCRSVCPHVHIGIDKGYADGKAVLISLRKFGCRVAPKPRTPPLVSPSLLGPHQPYSHFSSPVFGSPTLLTVSSSAL